MLRESALGSSGHRLIADRPMLLDNHYSELLSDCSGSSLQLIGLVHVVPSIRAEEKAIEVQSAKA